MNIIGKRIKTEYGYGTVIKKEFEVSSSKFIRYEVELDEPNPWSDITRKYLSQYSNPYFLVSEMEFE